MNKIAFGAALVVLGSSPGAAQYAGIYDVIGQTVANSMNAGIPDVCLDGRRQPSSNQLSRFDERRDAAFEAYLAIARAGGDFTPTFTNRSYDRRWSLDGTVATFGAIRDPWADRIARLEPAGHRLGNMSVRGRAVYRAYAADGRLLGTYDVLFRRTTRGYEISSLDLFSAGAANQSKPVAMFCYTPGDTEEYLAAVAKRKAEKEAKRAAKEAARIGGQQ